MITLCNGKQYLLYNGYTYNTIGTISKSGHNRYRCIGQSKSKRCNSYLNVDSEFHVHYESEARHNHMPPSFKQINGIYVKVPN
ncbi:unnamed protein product [Leptosia nina]|uniref:FLYWCH-type domain-containing protein n=1 Tax=Leptosia nina TaxID=320188 RepID=A0AAV1J4S5_9NEOP